MDWSSMVITILPGVIVALTTSYFSARFYSHRVRAELQKEFESRFNERKWEVYMQFAEIIRKLLENTKTNEDKAQKEFRRIIHDLYGFTSNLWLVGSDEVVSAFLEWQKNSRAAANSREAIAGLDPLYKLADILIAMRKDLGYSTSHLTAREILATIITDLE